MLRKSQPFPSVKIAAFIVKVQPSVSMINSIELLFYLWLTTKFVSDNFDLCPNNKKVMREIYDILFCTSDEKNSEEIFQQKKRNFYLHFPEGGLHILCCFPRLFGNCNEAILYFSLLVLILHLVWINRKRTTRELLRPRNFKWVK